MSSKFIYRSLTNAVAQASELIYIIHRSSNASCLIIYRREEEMKDESTVMSDKAMPLSHFSLLKWQIVTQNYLYLLLKTTHVLIK